MLTETKIINNGLSQKSGLRRRIKRNVCKNISVQTNKYFWKNKQLKFWIK